jgi:chromosomal replication initiation ATPase DnaA
MPEVADLLARSRIRHAIERLEAIEARIARLEAVEERRARLEAGRGGERSTDAIERLIETVAESHGVTKAAIMGRSRRQHHVAARHELWRRLREMGWSMIRIARLCRRDHSSVVKALGALMVEPEQVQSEKEVQA